jgi:hypothetical protein
MDEIQQRIERGDSITISMALESLRPGAAWAVSDNVYSGLEWRDDVHEKPTEQEVIDEVERLKLLKEQLQYRQYRKKEYPSIEECVHALLDGDLDELQARRQAVKEKYPKRLY